MYGSMCSRISSTGGSLSSGPTPGRPRVPLVVSKETGRCCSTPRGCWGSCPGCCCIWHPPALLMHTSFYIFIRARIPEHLFLTEAIQNEVRGEQVTEFEA